MDLLTAILTCSLFVSDDPLVRAIAESTPESNPYSVVDTTLDVTQLDAPPPPKTAADAAARARAILAAGGKPLLGLLELPAGWLDSFGRDLDAAFDPCVNIAVGTAMLSSFDDDCARGRRRDAKGAAPRSATRRRCVLLQYERAIGSPDFALTVTFELRHQRALPTHVADAPILIPIVAAPRWGPSELLVPLPPAPLSSPP